MKLNHSNDPTPPESGNIFGWRVSLIGLAFILSLAALATYRHYSLQVPVGFDDPLEAEPDRDYYQTKAEQESATLDSLRNSRQ